MKKQRGVFVPDDETKFGGGENDPPYQHEKYKTAVKLCRRFDHAVDVGAHVGSWTLQMLADFAHVTAFEPNAVIWPYFRANVPDDGRVELWRLALGATRQQVSLIEKAGTNLKTHVSSKVLDRFAAGNPVPMARLDDFNVPTVDFLKIDCEGYDFFVVQGAAATIQRDRPVIIVEQKPGVASRRYGLADDQAVDLLRGWGYSVSAVLNGDYIMEPPNA